MEELETTVLAILIILAILTRQGGGLGSIRWLEKKNFSITIGLIKCISATYLEHSSKLEWPSKF